MDDIQKIVRTFHPIGQGAFYSERFYDEKRAFNVVFDCGVDSVQDYHKAIVLDAFSKNDTINYLFISHLDIDHISLVKTLKDSVKRIDHVVLPFIDDRSIKLHYSLSTISDAPDVSSFWEAVRSALTDEERDNNSPRFLFVMPVGMDYYPRESSRMEYRPSGELVASFTFQNRGRYWEYIPFCQYSERESELDQKLTDLLQDSEFCAALKSLKIHCASLDELKDLLASGVFADMISNKLICNKLHKAYSSISGSINQNSLLVYSGPDSSDDTFRMDSSRPYNCSLFSQQSFFSHIVDLIPDRVACLYTGDSDLDMFFYKNHLNELWEIVGTIQLPHHGSHNSFKISYNRVKFGRPYLFPVSFGQKNHFHHPSGKVLSFLLGAGCLPVPVTDDYCSLFKQVITFID